MSSLAYLHIGEFANTVCPNNIKPRFFVMLTAYFDASKSEEGKPFISIGGCLAREEKWKVFQIEWQKILDDEGLKFFHMTDFEGYHQEYKEWSKSRHIACFKRIANVICAYTEYAFSIGVALNDYRNAKKINKPLDSWSPFTFCAIQCLYEISQWANSNAENGPITYVFERGDGYTQELYALKDKIESSREHMIRFRYAGLHILPKIEDDPPYPLTPLQAADIWAFEGRKEYENKGPRHRRIRPFRKSIQALLHSKVEGGFYTKDNLLKLSPSRLLQ